MDFFHYVIFSAAFLFIVCSLRILYLILRYRELNLASYEFRFYIFFGLFVFTIGILLALYFGIVPLRRKSVSITASPIGWIIGFIVLLSGWVTCLWAFLKAIREERWIVSGRS